MPPILKRNLLILAAGVILLLLLVGIAFGGKWVYHEATKERPNWSTGQIIAKEFHPAHQETRSRQQYAGEDCHYSTLTKSSECEPHYITVFYNVTVPDKWEIRIQNCSVAKKDGTIWSHKDGTPKCFKKWVTIYQTAYDRVKIGQTWEG